MVKPPADSSRYRFMVFPDHSRSNVRDEDCAGVNLFLLDTKIKLSMRSSYFQSAGSFDAALTAADYFLNLARFTLHSLTEQDTHVVSYMQRVIKICETILRMYDSPLKENKARSESIESCLRDLSISLEQYGPIKWSGCKYIRINAESPGQWEPFFKSPELFSSDAAREFMTGLRCINIKVRTSTPRVILKELDDLFSRSQLDQIILSDLMTDTAMRSIHFILDMLCLGYHNVKCFLNKKDLGQTRHLLIRTCITAINRPENLREKELNSLAYKDYVEGRGEIVLTALTLLTFKVLKEGASGPVLEPERGAKASALWLKLEPVVSVEALIKGKEEEICPVCHEENVTQRNFSLLDSCDHMFCAVCIETWFLKRSICPLCRSHISSWTTRDNLAATLYLKSLINTDDWFPWSDEEPESNEEPESSL